MIDKLFPNEARYEINRAFLNEAEEESTSIFNLFELLGIASFNLNEVELTKLFKGFGEALPFSEFSRSCSRNESGVQ